MVCNRDRIFKANSTPPAPPPTILIDKGFSGSLPIRFKTFSQASNNWGTGLAGITYSEPAIFMRVGVIPISIDNISKAMGGQSAQIT